MGEKASSLLEDFNKRNFVELKLKTSNLILNEEYALTFVADLPEDNTAINYYTNFNEKVASLSELRNHKFNNFVSTKENFDIFYRTKGLNEYLRFFEKNYQTKNQ